MANERSVILFLGVFIVFSIFQQSYCHYITAHHRFSADQKEDDSSSEEKYELHLPKKIEPEKHRGLKYEVQISKAKPEKSTLIYDYHIDKLVLPNAKCGCQKHHTHKEGCRCHQHQPEPVRPLTYDPPSAEGASEFFTYVTRPAHVVHHSTIPFVAPPTGPDSAEPMPREPRSSGAPTLDGPRSSEVTDEGKTIVKRDTQYAQGQGYDPRRDTNPQPSGYPAPGYPEHIKRNVDYSDPRQYRHDKEPSPQYLEPAPPSNPEYQYSKRDTVYHAGPGHDQYGRGGGGAGPVHGQYPYPKRGSPMEPPGQSHDYARRIPTHGGAAHTGSSYLYGDRDKGYGLPAHLNTDYQYNKRETEYGAPVNGNGNYPSGKPEKTYPVNEYPYNKRDTEYGVPAPIAGSYQYGVREKSPHTGYSLGTNEYQYNKREVEPVAPPQGGAFAPRQYREEVAPSPGYQYRKRNAEVASPSPSPALTTTDRLKNKREVNVEEEEVRKLRRDVAGDAGKKAARKTKLARTLRKKRPVKKE